MWTIFNSEGKAMSNCDFEPNHNDLFTRGERAYFHDEPIALPEAYLLAGTVERKPLVILSAEVVDNMATVTVDCEDSSVTDIPLVIAGVTVTKPVGDFLIRSEPGIKLNIDLDRAGLRGDSLEVCF